MITDSQALLATDQIIFGIIVIGLIGLVSDLLFKWANRSFCSVGAAGALSMANTSAPCAASSAVSPASTGRRWRCRRIIETIENPHSQAARLKSPSFSLPSLLPERP